VGGAGEFQEVQPAHRFDEHRLDSYLRANLEGYGTGLTVRQVAGGASNPTFLLETDGPSSPRRYILRKKPPGKLLASAHQVEREHRVMRALADTDVPVPNARLLCEDPEVVGTPFYVMNFIEGRVFRDAKLPDLAPSERAVVYDQLNDVLAKLHKVDFRAVGLSDYGRPEAYLARQIARWTRQYREAQTEDIPAMERLIEYLPAHLPPEEPPAIAHGDYRLENVIFHPTRPRLLAVLDWELSTIGDPLADIAYNCLLYHFDSGSWGALKGVDFAAAGIPDEASYVAAYCRRTGRDRIENWNYYLAFALFRLASIGQGVFKRVQDGILSADRAAANSCVDRAQQAWGLVAP
jgi:aminoglycoside phosphotransferase (APT) family kinase protein